MTNSEKSAMEDFTIWRDLLRQTVELAGGIGCQAAVVDVLQRMIGEPKAEEWHLGMNPTFLGDYKSWDKFAKEAVAKVAAEDLGKLISQAFTAQLRFEQLLSSRMDSILLSRVYPDTKGLPRLTSKAWSYINWASSIVVLAALKRKPVIDDQTAISLLKASFKAILNWTNDFVSEPDLPMKEVMNQLASHRFTVVEQTRHLANRIDIALTLVPASDAADRKYVASLKSSVEAIKSGLVVMINPPSDNRGRVVTTKA